MFFFPLFDDNPTRRTPIVTIAIIALCVLVFLWQWSLGPRGDMMAVYAFGVIPAALFGHAERPDAIAFVPPWATVVTSMFLHGGFLHLAGNMLYLWIFGNNVEDSMGRGRFVVFYLLCGTAAALAQSVAAPLSEVPMIGASGAIGGVLGAYMVLHPHANVGMLFWFIIIVRIIYIPAVLVLGVWFIMQIMSGVTTPTTGEGGVAFWAHVGGFVAGVVLIPFFRRRDVTLFARPNSRPFQTVPPGTIRQRRGSVPEAGRIRRP